MSVKRSTAEPISRPGLAACSNNIAPQTDSSCLQELQRLYQQVLQRRPDDVYMKLHSRLNSIRRRIDVFNLYRNYIPKDGVVLDWGCKHAPDSCLLRHTFGDRIRILGYDFDRGDNYQEFHDYAGLDFTVAEHTYRLPYPDGSIDAIICSGVLEHAALPSQSLTELYRVMAPHGILVVSFLPNSWSYTEQILRWTGRGHRRFYTRSTASRLLLDHGFDPQHVGYHQFVPAQRGAKFLNHLWFLNRMLEKTWPFRMFCANIYAIAIKRLAI